MMPSDNNNQLPGIKHWLFQIVPPLSMLGILLATEHGSALVFLAGIFIIPVLVSIISIIAKLIFFKKRKYYLIRPCLTIVIFILILTIAQWTYNIALEQAISSAEIIHKQCNENRQCPEHPDGWNVEDSRISRNNFGVWLKYSASYYYNEHDFNIRVYHGPDLGDHIIGGLDTQFRVEPYQDGS